MKRTSRKPSKLSSSLQRHLNAYALAASAAGVGVLALASPAEARIIYTKTHRRIHGLGDQINLDLNRDGVTDFTLSIYRTRLFYGTRLQARPAYSRNTIRASSSGGSYAAAYRAGVRIGPKGYAVEPPKHPYGYLLEYGCLGTNSRCEPRGKWLNVENRYLGLAFDVNRQTHYGWARLSASGTRGLDVYPSVRATLTGYAYETIPNKPIITGKTKGPDVITLEPGSLGALAAGAIGRSGK